jgi:hypothetical protein
MGVSGSWADAQTSVEAGENAMDSVPQQRTWLQRNTKWIVLGAVLLGVLLLGLFLAAILMIVAGAMRSSDVYKESLARAQASPQVAALVGTPVEPGFFTTGSINVENRTGDADLHIPIHGPKGEATIDVVARKRDGKWIYDTMRVGEVDLLR